MRYNFALVAVPVLAAGTLLVPAAHAADPPADPPAADLQLVYESPEITADNSGATWHWTLSNQGSGGAETVIATQKVSAGQKVVGVSKPCTDKGDEVVCQYGSIGPGEKRVGWIKTTVAAGTARLRVNAQVTWRERQLTPPSTDAGAGAPGEPGEGAFSTETTADMPKPAGDTGAPKVPGKDGLQRLPLNGVAGSTSQQPH
jgi:hypothetical protein